MLAGQVILFAVFRIFAPVLRTPFPYAFVHREKGNCSHEQDAGKKKSRLAHATPPEQVNFEPPPPPRAFRQKQPLLNALRSFAAGGHWFAYS